MTRDIASKKKTLRTSLKLNFAKICVHTHTHTYRMGHEKVARLPLCTCPCYFPPRLVVLDRMCIDAGGNHFQHLLWWFILSAFGYCINFCIYAMLRTRATFSWPIPYISMKKKLPTDFMDQYVQQSINPTINMSNNQYVQQSVCPTINKSDNQ